MEVLFGRPVGSIPECTRATESNVFLEVHGLDPGEEFGAESWPYLVERLFLAVYFVEAVVRALASGS